MLLRAPAISLMVLVLYLLLLAATSGKLSSQTHLQHSQQYMVVLGTVLV